ncbi:gliding motility-associated ABC transporter substrate-binding protein GldG [Pedobacter sp. PACM 27299]|uniref:gliding motility-associated ABC transporter substrate-binding protein GldG n=1 Tax=Pedobacter sp. PACM 27299 TaxID=1727164 RepID=UPI00070651AF|nr:gliding motility-associated ABC transporter substrate-binding protein GldG [Pedobacter sp. PACM 27299]ALL04927.1 gliding motility-associated ABC transporter substrate-binding protein GldG [Pedobacter sp. PACM 27299]
MVIKQRKIVSIAIFIIALVLINVLAQYVYTRIDFTKEKRYTLTLKSKEILKNIKHPITITVFLDGDLPAPFKRLRNATKDLLADYRAAAGQEIKVIFKDPISGLSIADQDTVINHLYSAGIEPTTINIKNDAGFAQKIVFPMAMLESPDRQLPVKLLQNLGATGGYEENINNSIQNLEYLFTSAIQQVLSSEHPRIGFTEGNGELTDLMLNDAITTLSDNYEVGRVNLNTIDAAGLDKLKTLIIAKPQQEFTEAEKYKINYFVMKGGRVVWAIDQVSADLDSLKDSGEQLAFNKKLNLDDMLFMYGSRINYNLIADANCAEIPLSMGGNGQIEMAPWVYYPLIQPDTSHNLVKNIDVIRGEFVSTIDTIAVKGLKKTVILHSSPFNKVFNAPKLLSLQMVAEQPDPRDYASKPQALGVLIEGSFPSVFLNRSVPAGITGNYPLPATSKPTKMIVIGDGDVFKNQISSKDGSAFPLGFDRYTQKNYGNKALLLNIADYLSNDHHLIALRNKEVKIRLLDKAKLRTEKLQWQLVNMALPLLLLISFAIFQHYYRKYKYAR